MNLDAAQPPDNIKKFIARCQTRALLWQLGDFTLQEAVDELERIRTELAIDTDTAQAIMADAFAAVQS